MSDVTRRVPRTERGEKTREVLLAAAQEVFWKKGYVDARVADIVEHAGMSHGSFYTYFDSKEAVLWALASDLDLAVYDSGRGTLEETGGDEVRAIELANRRYLEYYLANRKAMRLMEEVAASNSKMNKARRNSRERIVERTVRSLKRMQADGVCDPGLDAELAAQALVSMVSHFTYYMVATHKPVDIDAAAATLTTLWARGIGIDIPWGKD
ncbi:MAG: TetR/AcrR family transcriptional regulator [Acidimicrobiales bacterium]